MLYFVKNLFKPYFQCLIGLRKHSLPNILVLKTLDTSEISQLQNYVLNDLSSRKILKLGDRVWS